jgi:oligopeptide/dipeptide ABC transporter ATP-binding protein
MLDLHVTSNGDAADAASSPLLDLRDVSVGFRIGGRWTDVVRSATFTVERGEILGVVGESGSGKTVTSLAVSGLVQHVGGRITSGQVLFDGTDVTQHGERQWSRLRGRQIGMIFQQPTRSLNPAFTVGDQISESIRIGLGLRRKEAWQRAVELLDRVRIPDAARRAHDYPHTFSGGMCQRVMIAMALACEPRLLIADEPTTALDVTVQARVLELLRELQAENDLTIVYISHDLGVIAQLCDRVAVMYAGETVEVGPLEDILTAPQHPYTSGLLQSIPEMDGEKRLPTIPGSVPGARAMPAGCRFHPRCEFAVDTLCTSEALPLLAANDRHVTRCARYAELDLAGVRDGVA